LLQERQADIDQAVRTQEPCDTFEKRQRIDDVFKHMIEHQKISLSLEVDFRIGDAFDGLQVESELLSSVLDVFAVQIESVTLDAVIPERYQIPSGSAAPLHHHAFLPVFSRGL